MLGRALNRWVEWPGWQPFPSLQTCEEGCMFGGLSMVDLLLISDGGPQQRQSPVMFPLPGKEQPVIPAAPGFLVLIADGGQERKRLIKHAQGLD